MSPDGVKLTEPSGSELGHFYPQALADGKHVIFTVFRGSRGNRNRAACCRYQGAAHPGGATYGRLTPTGHLVYVRDETLFAVPFDRRRLEVRGRPVPILYDVAMSRDSGNGDLAFSDSGLFVHVPGSLREPRRQLLWVDRSGVEETVFPKLERWEDPRLSHDGRQLAVALLGENWDI